MRPANQRGGRWCPSDNLQLLLAKPFIVSLTPNKSSSLDASEIQCFFFFFVIKRNFSSDSCLLEGPRVYHFAFDVLTGAAHDGILSRRPLLFETCCTAKVLDRLIRRVFQHPKTSRCAWEPPRSHASPHRRARSIATERSPEPKTLRRSIPHPAPFRILGIPQQCPRNLLYDSCVVPITWVWACAQTLTPQFSVPVQGRPVAHGGGGSDNKTRGSGGDASKPTDGQAAPSDKNNGRGRKRKSDSQGSRPGGAPGGGPGGDPGGGQGNDNHNTGLKDKPAQKQFACIYFKANPFKHIHCLNYSQGHVRHVKQHVFRNHCWPDHYCPVCYLTCNSQQEWEDHFGQENCLEAEHPFGDKITQDQKDLLDRYFKTDSRGHNDEEQWYAIFRIVFPSLPDPESPYGDTAALLCDIRAAGSRELESEIVDQFREEAVHADDVDDAERARFSRIMSTVVEKRSSNRGATTSHPVETGPAVTALPTAMDSQERNASTDSHAQMLQMANQVPNSTAGPRSARVQGESIHDTSSPHASRHYIDENGHHQVLEESVHDMARNVLPQRIPDQRRIPVRGPSQRTTNLPAGLVNQNGDIFLDARGYDNSGFCETLMSPSQDMRVGDPAGPAATSPLSPLAFYNMPPSSNAHFVSHNPLITSDRVQNSLPQPSHDLRHSIGVASTLNTNSTFENQGLLPANTYLRGRSPYCQNCVRSNLYCVGVPHQSCPTCVANIFACGNGEI